MSPSRKIAIIGAGSVGGNLGARFAHAGHFVRFGVRPGTDTDTVALLERCGERASVAEPLPAAAFGDFVVLAVPGTVAAEVAEELTVQDDSVVIDCTNPLRWDDGPVWNPPSEGSVTAAIAARLPNARVVKAFNTFGAEFHDDPGLGAHAADVFVAGDPSGREEVAALARSAGFAPIDAGPLRNAAVLENVAMLWIHLALVGDVGRDFAMKLLRSDGSPVATAE